MAFTWQYKDYDFASQLQLQEMRDNIDYIHDHLANRVDDGTVRSGHWAPYNSSRNSPVNSTDVGTYNGSRRDTNRTGNYSDHQGYDTN